MKEFSCNRYLWQIAFGPVFPFATFLVVLIRLWPQLLHLQIVVSVKTGERIRPPLLVRRAEVRADNPIAPEILERKNVRADEASHNNAEDCDEDRPHYQ